MVGIYNAAETGAMKLVKPSSKMCYCLFEGVTSYVDHLCDLCLVFVMLSRMFIAALWLPAGKELTPRL